MARTSSQSSTTTVQSRRRRATLSREIQEGIQESNHGSRWTEEQEQTLIRYAKVHCQNLHFCFTAVAEQIGRTPAAVGSHWYTSTSKRPDVCCFFTASEKHVSKNRKNGMGVESTPSIWRRLMQVIRNL